MKVKRFILTLVVVLSIGTAYGTQTYAIEKHGATTHEITAQEIIKNTANHSDATNAVVTNKKPSAKLDATSTSINKKSGVRSVSSVKATVNKKSGNPAD